MKPGYGATGAESALPARFSGRGFVAGALDAPASAAGFTHSFALYPLWEKRFALNSKYEYNYVTSGLVQLWVM